MHLPHDCPAPRPAASDPRPSDRAPLVARARAAAPPPPTTTTTAAMEPAPAAPPPASIQDFQSAMALLRQLCEQGIAATGRGMRDRRGAVLGADARAAFRAILARVDALSGSTSLANMKDAVREVREMLVGVVGMLPAGASG